MREAALCRLAAGHRSLPRAGTAGLPLSWCCGREVLYGTDIPHGLPISQSLRRRMRHERAVPRAHPPARPGHPGQLARIPTHRDPLDNHSNTFLSWGQKIFEAPRFIAVSRIICKISLIQIGLFCNEISFDFFVLT